MCTNGRVANARNQDALFRLFLSQESEINGY